MHSPARSLPPRGGSSNLSTLLEEEDAALFEAPSELVCPITHAVFLDPVLTQAGHAYERTSIEQHLRTTDTDPMSNQRLLNSSLTPVFVLKSRALEYRESTSRLCVNRACSVSPPRPPIDYLRRAVELCSDAGFLPKGLASDVVSYVSSHLSNVYDRLALDVFAQSLHDNGYKDKAAAVYFHLLVTEEDKTAQAEMLKRCLSCWQAGGTTLTRGGRGAGGGGDGSNGSSSSNNISTKNVDSHVFEKLIQMIDTTGAQFGWLIEVSSGAGLGNSFIAKLCEHILFPQRAMAVSLSNPNFLSSSPPSSSSLVPVPGSGVHRNSSTRKVQGSLPWDTEKEVLLRYCFVLTEAVKEENTEMNNKIKILEDTLLHGGRGGKSNRRRSRFLNGRWGTNSSLYNNDGENEEENGSELSIGDGDGFGLVLNNALSVFQRAVRHPFVMVPCAVVAAFGDPHNPVVRSTCVLPFVALMSGNNFGGGGGGRQFSSVLPESPLVEGEGAERSSSNTSDSSEYGITTPKA